MTETTRDWPPVDGPDEALKKLLEAFRREMSSPHQYLLDGQHDPSCGYCLLMASNRARKEPQP